MSHTAKTCVEASSKVLVRFLSGRTESYVISDSHSADPAAGIISSESPLGKALLEKSKGDKIVYSVGDRAIEAEIGEIF